MRAGAVLVALSSVHVQALFLQKNAQASMQLLQSKAEIMHRGRLGKADSDFNNDEANLTNGEQKLVNGEGSDAVDAYRGFFKARPSDNRCFISKKTLFTLTHPLLPPLRGCRTSRDLQDVENIAGSSDQAECLACMTWMKQKLGGNINRLRRFFWTDTIPDSCEKCSDKWSSKCINKDALVRNPNGGYMGPKEIDDAHFQAQENFMLALASGLHYHDVSLYLDFADEAMKDLIENKCGGRSVAFGNPSCYLKMLYILQGRVAESEHFVHWIGSSGNFCLAEQSGYNSAQSQGVALTFPAVSAAQDPRKRAECWVDPHDRFRQPLLQKICYACGGTNCHLACLTRSVFVGKNITEEKFVRAEAVIAQTYSKDTDVVHKEVNMTVKRVAANMTKDPNNSSLGLLETSNGPWDFSRRRHYVRRRRHWFYIDLRCGTLGRTVASPQNEQRVLDVWKGHYSKLLPKWFLPGTTYYVDDWRFDYYNFWPEQSGEYAMGAGFSIRKLEAVLQKQSGKDSLLKTTKRYAQYAIYFAGPNHPRHVAVRESRTSHWFMSKFNYPGLDGVGIGPVVRHRPEDLVKFAYVRYYSTATYDPNGVWCSSRNGFAK